MKLLSAALIIALTALSVAPAIASERQIHIYAKNFSFTPGTITLEVHQRAKLVFVGKGNHGITIPEIGLNRIVTIGTKPTIVEVTPGHIGTFIARCAIYCGIGHGKMVLKVKVVK
ncbi:MAG: cupredoxin domain-containing protein [Candidatus Eremiobacteraeota bacterium]|nr:cupredoxin domain-containing protein [Candidatus Eremiobacteraeota bacterium]